MKIKDILFCFLALIPAPLLRAAAIHVPTTFEQNRGQAPAGVKWIGRSPNYLLLFEEEGVTLLIPEKKELHSRKIEYDAIRMRLAGSLPWTDISGERPTGGVSNYLQTARAEIKGIPHFQRIKIAHVYEGIDLVFHTDGTNLEYDFVLAPGADPSSIRMEFQGQKAMRVDAPSGDLVLTAENGFLLRQHRPHVYQQVANRDIDVSGGYRLLGQGQAGFRLATYDRSRALTIDPTVDFTSFVGGSGDDAAFAIALDAQGDTYITGVTQSMNFPVTNKSSWENAKNFSFLGFASTPGNIFVAELNPSGKLVFASYGGVGFGNAIAVDSSGVYVTGEVYPPDFDNVIGFSDNNDGDAFVWRVESQQGFQDYSRVYGKSGEDFGSAIGVDSAHNAWIAGATYDGRSANNPKSGDLFIVKVIPDGTNQVSYTYASNGEDKPDGLAIGPATGDHAWITGKTCGDGFPTTDGMVHALSHCGVFLLVLENSGVQDVGMVFGGTGGDDEGIAVVPNGPNSAYIAGTVNSSDFPVTAGAFQTMKTAGTQGFVTQVDTTLPAGKIVHSTFFGADGMTVPTSVANADGKGVYLAGYTSSVHLPNGPVQAPTPTAGFITKFSVDLSQVRYTQLLQDGVGGIAVANPIPGTPVIYAAGPGSRVDTSDAFVAKLEESTPTSSIASLPAEIDDPSFTLRWAGTDSTMSIATYDIYVADNFGAFVPFLTGTAATSATFQGTLGHTYSFYSIATDAAGNREPMKTGPDAVVRLGPAPAATITCTNCMFLNNGAKATVSFNVSMPGSRSMFSFSNGSSSQPVKFASSDVSKISVTGSFATFSGDGSLNGQAGYTFTVSATDGAGVGSDTVLVQIAGPNNFAYNAPATITGGDIVVHQ